MNNSSDETTYRVIFGGSSVKDLKKIIMSGNKNIKKRVMAKANELKIDPYTKRPKADIKLISSREEGVYRIKIGDFRMVYDINEDDKIVSITMIFHRGKGY